LRAGAAVEDLQGVVAVDVHVRDRDARHRSGRREPALFEELAPSALLHALSGVNGTSRQIPTSRCFTDRSLQDENLAVTLSENSGRQRKQRDLGVSLDWVGHHGWLPAPRLRDDPVARLHAAATDV